LDDIKNKSELIQQAETEQEAIKKFTRNKLFFSKKLEFAFANEIKM
jgi:cell division protein FtsB